MLNQLTSYLLQYKRVSVPSVGTIRLVQTPSQFSVADKLILPPSFAAEIVEDETIPEHQLNFLSAQLKEERESVLQSLQQIGDRLNEDIRDKGFHWNGIGLIQRSGRSAAIPLPTLEPVPAEKVLRENAEHQVLVGDQQMTLTQIAGLKDGTDASQKTSVFMIIGWILLALSILYIVFVLWQGKFRVGASGSKQSSATFILQQNAQPGKV